MNAYLMLFAVLVVIEQLLKLVELHLDLLVFEALKWRLYLKRLLQGS